MSFYDPATDKFTLIHTCFPTHHLNFGSDADQTLWLQRWGGRSGCAGMAQPKMYEETGDEVKAQGWSPSLLDADGNGRRDEYVEPAEPVDPAKDKRVTVNIYSVAISPADGSIWGSALGYPGYAVGSFPEPIRPTPRSRKSTTPPAPGFGPRGATSIRTAFSGYRLRAATSGASTGASATCSMDLRRPATIARKGGRSPVAGAAI